MEKDNRGRSQNGMLDTNRNEGLLSPTGTSSEDQPLIQSPTPAEGQSGQPRSRSDRQSTFRRWGQSTAGDAPGWGRSGYGRDAGFGPFEYGGSIDEREESRQSQRNRSLEPQDRRARASANSSRWWQRETLSVSDVMTSNVKSVGPDATARDIAEIMKQEDVGVIPVVDPDGRLFGLVTDRDLVVRALAGGRALDEARAAQLATTDIEVVGPRDPLSAVVELMGRQQIRRVPVIDEDDTLVGIVAIADIARQADYHDDLQEALEKISGRRSFWSRIWR